MQSAKLSHWRKAEPAASAAAQTGVYPLLSTSPPLPLPFSTLLCASFFVCCINCNTNRRAAKCERGTVHSTLYLCICVSHGYTDTAHTDSFVGVAECEMLLSFHVSAATEFYVRHGQQHGGLDNILCLPPWHWAWPTHTHTYADRHTTSSTYLASLWV